jgi:hypothetical protein
MVALRTTRYRSVDETPMNERVVDVDVRRLSE